jgi:putative MATE family efflux protein
MGAGSGRTRRWRSPHDREIVRLALPAFGALIAEPLYLLADTAIVGHLGTRPLGGIAIAAIVLTATFGIFNFLAYTTTGTVARHVGAGDERAAVEHGIDGVWLAIGLGLALTVFGVITVPFITSAMGASHAVEPYAAEYLRISLLGSPFVLIALACAGYLRGAQDTRTTLLVAVGANVANLAIEIVLVYGFDTGIAGSAWGTVAAQIGAAAVFVMIVRSRAAAHRATFMPRPAGIRAAAFVGSQLVVRTGSLLLALLATTAVAARISDTALAAHQIAFQIWAFLALTLDAIAIAGQALVGRYLGADDGPGARTVARRMLQLGIGAGVVIAVVVGATRGRLVVPFTTDPAVRDLAEQVLLVVALLQPVAAAVFVFDGILIGAGDARYLAAAMVVASVIYGGLLAVAVRAGAGLLWLWAAFAVWMGLRWLGLSLRFRSDRWIVTGTVRTR